MPLSNVINPEYYDKIVHKPPIIERRVEFSSQLWELLSVAKSYWDELHPFVQDLIVILYESSLQFIDRCNNLQVENDELQMKNIALQTEIDEFSNDEVELTSHQMQIKQEINAVIDKNERLRWKLKSVELSQKEVNDKLSAALKENFNLKNKLEDLTTAEAPVDTQKLTLIDGEDKLEIPLIDLGLINGESRKSNKEDTITILEGIIQSIYEEKESLENINKDLKNQLNNIIEKGTAESKNSENIVEAEESKPLNYEIIEGDSKDPILQERNKLLLELAKKNRELVALNREKKIQEEHMIELLELNNRTKKVTNILIEMRKLTLRQNA